ncbi:hypothetical protein [Allorhodopirellula solitaria]|uniref:Uncharacterized protein n=1 Tax=Allorhodopirellula solitaria TaxID=2527987 RepID=A0A5C5YDI4_9BACT|nr:hypothetical protein [Allorhodopirellula solitaria]TWT72863.1 hypothetical protein CA85_13240 [Allorhodopirellula solitaria]
MGGFSASYLVHATDAETVAQELQRLLSEEGWQPCSGPLCDEDMWGVGGARRGLILCQPIGGWVAVIDSAAMVSETPTDLSRALSTSIFNFHVHDSDFWTYTLVQEGQTVDRFTSMDEHAYFGDALGDTDPLADDGGGAPTPSLEERWDILSDCLGKGVTRADLDDALSPIDLSSLDHLPIRSGEEGLANFLKLLGADPSLADLSYR